MTDVPTTAVILAGGLGTRLRDVVSKVPKPMAAVKGRPFLEHLIRYWEKQGIKRFILSVGYKGEIIKEYFGNSFGNISIEYVEEPVPLGTGGALVKCCKEKRLAHPFFLLNGDTFFKVDALSICSLAKDKDASWVFSLFQSNDFLRYSTVELRPDHSIDLSPSISATRTSSSAQQALSNGGVYWINPESIQELTRDWNGQNISLESQVFDYLSASKERVFGIFFNRFFVDIGVPVDYLKAQSCEEFAEQK